MYAGKARAYPKVEHLFRRKKSFTAAAPGSEE
jgi:hypothetical protein